MPKISVIVPCYNEQDTIKLLLRAIYMQSFPRGEMEVIIADGLSSDQTRAKIAAFCHNNPDLAVTIVDNPKRNIPAALNRALEAAMGEFIVRLDAHSVPHQDYVSRCVQALEEARGENVGGVWEITPRTDDWKARSIAAAAAHPLGVGDAHYRYTKAPMYVDTVPFGSFRRSLVDQIGPFDETLLANEDYEFNVRIRKSGGRVWLDPAIRSKYFSRKNFTELAHQYLRYGFWKARMLKRYPETLRWRQGLPPLFITSIFMLALVSPWIPIFRWFLGAELIVYAGVLFTAGLRAALREKLMGYVIGIPLAIVTMHICWGAALIWSSILMLFERSPQLERPVNG